jgi:hypothetical protein
MLLTMGLERLESSRADRCQAVAWQEEGLEGLKDHLRRLL